MLHTNFDSTLSDHGAVGLVDNVIDELEVVRVRDDLVLGDDILLNNCGVSQSAMAGQSRRESIAKTVRGVGVRKVPSMSIVPCK